MSSAASQRHGKWTVVVFVIVTSPMTLLYLYISRWCCQTWDTCIYFMVVSQSESGFSTERAWHKLLYSLITNWTSKFIKVPWVLAAAQENRYMIRITTRIIAVSLKIYYNTIFINAQYTIYHRIVTLFPDVLTRIKNFLYLERNDCHIVASGGTNMCIYRYTNGVHQGRLRTWTLFPYKWKCDISQVKDRLIEINLCNWRYEVRSTFQLRTFILLKSEIVPGNYVLSFLSKKCFFIFRNCVGECLHAFKISVMMASPCKLGHVNYVMKMYEMMSFIFCVPVIFMMNSEILHILR